jgi:hypothetical protein
VYVVGLSFRQNEKLVRYKTVVLWDVARCRSLVNRRFGGAYCLHLQGNLKSYRVRCKFTVMADNIYKHYRTLYFRAYLYLYILNGTDFNRIEDLHLLGYNAA